MRIAAGIAGPVDYDGRRVDAGCLAGDGAQQDRGQGEAVTVGVDSVPAASRRFEAVQKRAVPVLQVPPVCDIYFAAG